MYSQSAEHMAPKGSGAAAAASTTDDSNVPSSFLKPGYIRRKRILIGGAMLVALFGMFGYTVGYISTQYAMFVLAAMYFSIRILR